MGLQEAQAHEAADAVRRAGFCWIPPDSARAAAASWQLRVCAQQTGQAAAQRGCPSQPGRGSAISKHPLLNPSGRSAWMLLFAAIIPDLSET